MYDLKWKSTFGLTFPIESGENIGPGGWWGGGRGAQVMHRENSYLLLIGEKISVVDWIPIYRV